MRGFLVVIEGIDGSGKTTQIDLLSQYLKQKGIDFECISFPQYGKNQYANQVHDYLSGKFGELDEVDPYFIAKAYASDRRTAKDLISGWLESGKVVIANRYISSSKAHLGAKVEESKRYDFIKWIDDLEYETNKMPKEDLTILLNVDPKIGQQNSQVKRHPDIHEDNLGHLEKTSEIFLKLSQTEGNWVLVNCMENGQMKSPKEIHEEIVELVSQKFPT